ncbi:MAG: SDR family NAD(P)-dependent oxidoreductase, partial [Ilumatobacteraceae bacterium]
MTRLADAHVVVTGGSLGIGLATAQACARRGARVSLIGRDAERLAEARRQLPEGTVTAAADVTDMAALEAAITQLVDARGPCDILVASAGRAEPGYFLDLDADVFARQVEVNYLGVVHAVRAVLPAMVARGRGHLVLVSSLAGLLGVLGY